MDIEKYSKETLKAYFKDKFGEDINEEGWESLNLKIPNKGWRTCAPSDSALRAHSWEVDGYEYHVTYIGRFVWRKKL